MTSIAKLWQPFLLLLPCLLTSDCLEILKTITQSCAVKTDQGTLDLSSLASSTDTAKFSADITSPDYAGALYWNPCKDVSPPGCKSDQPSTGEIYTLITGGTPIQTDCQVVGAKADSSFKIIDGKLSVEYLTEDDGFIIQFQCTKGSNELSLPDKSTPEALFSGTGACYTNAAGTTASPGGNTHVISAGSIILIIALALVFVYVVAGILVMKLYKKAEGTDVIPNKGFWAGLPGYVKDGVVFVIRRGKPGSAGYEDI